MNVDQLTMCCHNNRTHTESTAHIFKNGLNISECVHQSNGSHFGCIVISVEPVSIRTLKANEYRYECGAELDEERDYIVTKSKIGSKVKKVLNDVMEHKTYSFFKQSILILKLAQKVLARQISFHRLRSSKKKR